MDDNASRIKKIRYDINHLLFDEIDFSDAAFDAFDDRGRAELYLIRAQLKLLLFDETMLGDLETAQALLPGGTQFESLYSTMRFASPNLLVYFPTEREPFRRFWDALEKLQYPLAACTDENGYYLCAHFRGEMLYFSGNFRAAIALVKPLALLFKSRRDHLRAIIAYYTLIRCQIALGEQEAARESISDVVTWSQEGPVHKDIYSEIRNWLNVTTGWSGDSPRYHTVPDGTIVPVFEDRTVAVQQGTCRPFGSEAAFGRLAERLGAPTFHMRQLYLKIYQVVVGYQTATLSLAETNLPEVFQILRNTGFIQPIVEYGKQIIPTLTAALEQQVFDADWLNEMIVRAKAYEQNICDFRDEER